MTLLSRASKVCFRKGQGDKFTIPKLIGLLSSGPSSPLGERFNVQSSPSMELLHQPLVKESPQVCCTKNQSVGDPPFGWSSTSSKDLTGMLQHCEWLPLGMLLDTSSRFPFSTSRSFPRETSRTISTAKPEPSLRRDFIDVGIQNSKEEPLQTRNRTNRDSKPQASRSPSSVKLTESADGQGSSGPGGHNSKWASHSRFRSSSGGFVDLMSEEEPAQPPPQSGESASQDTQEKGKHTTTVWRDFEDLGSWVVDDESEIVRSTKKREGQKGPVDSGSTKERGKEMGHKIARAWVVDEETGTVRRADPLVVEADSGTIPSTKKEKQKMGRPGHPDQPPRKPNPFPKVTKKKSSQSPFVGGKLAEFQLRRFKGEQFTEEEKKMSLFDLCQLDSLRGVENVEDFLGLSDKDLLAQCDVHMGRGHSESKRGTGGSTVRLTHIPTGISVADGKTKSPASNQRRALVELKEKIALKVRRRISKLDPYFPPRRVRWMVPAVDLHPDWVMKKQTRIGPKTMDFLLGAQVLMDLLVSCNCDFVMAAEKLRMTEQRFRKLLNANIHVKLQVKLYKDWAKQRHLLDFLETRPDLYKEVYGEER